MKITNLSEDCGVYTSNVYLVTGTHNALADVNTLVDVGRDPQIKSRIEAASTGVGKKRIEQVILTHSHYDHAEMLSRVCEAFSPKVYVFSPQAVGEQRAERCTGMEELSDRQILRMGDRDFEVLHAPGHSSDSVCLFCLEDGVLFSGDTPLEIRLNTTEYENEFVRLIERLSQRDIRIIYPGHGKPISKGCNDMIGRTLKNLQNTVSDDAG